MSWFKNKVVENQNSILPRIFLNLMTDRRFV